MGTTTITACCAPVAEAALGEDEAEQLAAAFKVLADPVRLRLLSLVANAENGEACGCDLTEPVGRSQPTVSHHLRILRQAGMVEAEREGAYTWYRLVAGPITKTGQALETIGQQATEAARLRRPCG